MENIIGLKDLRLNMDKYIRRVKQEKECFSVFKHSKPLFRICPIEEDGWEEVVDFTRIKKGGVNIDDLLSRL